MNGENPKTQVVRYRWNKAHDSLRSAHQELAAGAYAFAINRAYFSLFYAISALLLEQGQRFSKHSGVRAAFNRDMVKPGHVGREYGDLYNQLFRDRQEGDYVEFTDFDDPYTREKIEMCEAFLKTLRPLFASLPPDEGKASLDSENLNH